MPKRITEHDLSLIHSSAIARYVAIPARTRLPGMIRDLNESEKRSIAFLEASAECLTRLGCMEPGALDGVALRTIYQTNSHSMLDEETDGMTGAECTKV